VFVAVHAYRFAPAEAFVLKNISPVAQLAGIALPAFIGLVEVAPVKSTPLLWVRRSICVCAHAVSPNRARAIVLSIPSLHLAR
jgi:hypothetical protein